MRRDRLDLGRLLTGEYARAIGLVALTTAVALPLRSRLQITDIAMLYLLPVVAVAARYRRAAAVLTTVLGIALFDLLFVPPYYTFAVQEPAYILTFLVMLAVALVMSGLTARIREHAEEAEARERRTAALYAMSSELTPVATPAEVISIFKRHLGQLLQARVIVLLDEEVGLESEAPRWPDDAVFESQLVRLAAAWTYRSGKSSGQGTPHSAEAEALIVPLRSSVRIQGVAVIVPEPEERTLERGQRLTAEVLAERAGIELERTVLGERHRRATVAVEAERLRSGLLSSVSHDLRTPLSAIESAGTSLLQDERALSAEDRRGMARIIVEESRRMSRLINNLLDLVRVEAGMRAVKQWLPLEEPVISALGRLEVTLHDHPVALKLPADLPLVPVDEVLLEQLLINLLENAAHHTPPGTGIAVSAWPEPGVIIVEVADQGPGVPPGAEEQVFDRFYRGPGAARESQGSGLGLAICRGIVAAHGGRIWVERHPGGGAAFRFSLPLEGPPIEAAIPTLHA